MLSVNSKQAFQIGSALLGGVAAGITAKLIGNRLFISKEASTAKADQKTAWITAPRVINVVSGLIALGTAAFVANYNGLISFRDLQSRISNYYTAATATAVVAKTQEVAQEQAIETPVEQPVETPAANVELSERAKALLNNAQKAIDDLTEGKE
ncbi:MAG: hypothetical protein ABSA17_08870 [Rhabdochlamydiaceae bacterium]|jgi:hypothetical protein